MNKAVILKIAGIIIVTFLVMIAAIFFLYPKLNEEKYDQIVDEFEQKQEEVFQNYSQDVPQEAERARYSGLNANINEVAQQNLASVVDSSFYELPDSLAPKDSVYSMMLNKAGNQIKQLEENELRLHGLIDSLYAEIDQLEMKIDSLQNSEPKEEQLDPAEFAERIKSLLNLEDEQLSPILENMNNEQIVKLYFAGGTIQRQKILRALEAKKAAEIMTEIM